AVGAPDHDRLARRRRALDQELFGPSLQLEPAVEVDDDLAEPVLRPDHRRRGAERGHEDVPVARVGPDADDEALASVPPAPAAGHGPEAQRAVVEEVAGLLGVAEVRLHAVARLERTVVQPERLLVVLDRAAAERARRVLELVADAGRRNVRIALGDAAHRPHAEIGDPPTDSRSEEHTSE